MDNVNKMKAFSVMPCGPAIFYYMKAVKCNFHTFDEIADHIRKRYITSKRTISRMQEWNSTKLKTYVSQHPNKTPRESLEMIIERLHTIQA